MLISLVILALAASAGALYYFSTDVPLAIPLHLALAVGALPLITGAILHFVPVLTRSQPPSRRWHALPWIMLAVGLLAFLSFLLYPPHPLIRDLAACLGIITAAALGLCITQSSRKSVGGPHPGVYWYLAATICLILGLTAVLLMQAWPTEYAALRRFHLHVNTLGFIGITAIGTLQVLLPTALGLPDKGVRYRLRTDWKYVFIGTLLIAIGAGWAPPLVWPGLFLWAIPLARLATAWYRLYTAAHTRWTATATAITGAFVGFLVTMIGGAAHATGTIPANNFGVTFIVAFLLPLLTAAAGYLLPTWVRPGPQAQWHLHARQRLGRFAALRTALFLAGGVISIWSIPIWGCLLAGLGMALFIIQLPVLATI